MKASFARLVLSFLMLFGGTLLLVLKLSADELVAGMATALLATGALVAVRVTSPRHYRIRASWLIRLARLPWSVLTDSVTILRAALRPVPQDGLGSSFAIPFRSDTGLPETEEAGRRALVLGGLSATPNAYVVLRRRDGDTLLMHQLVPGPPPGHGDPDWPLP